MAQSGWMLSISETFSSSVIGGPLVYSLRKWGLACVLTSVVLMPAVYAAEDEVPPDDDAAQEEADKPKEPPKPYVVPDAEKTRFEVLAQQADPREVMTLDTANEESVLSLYRPEHTPEARGALVILHEEDGHPDWPMVVNPVRTQMPDFGWATLSVAIPSPGPTDIPERSLPATEVLTVMPESEQEEDAAEDTAEGEGDAAGDEVPADEPPADEPPPDEEGDELGDGESEGEEPKADWPPPEPTFVPTEDKGPLAERVDARIDAAIRHLTETGYEQIILVGHGLGAVWIMDYLKDHPLPPQQAIVMIQPRMPQQDIEVDLNTLLLEQQRPILDLYYDDKRFNKRFAKERADTARRAGNTYYRQTRLGGLGMQSGNTDAKDRRIVQSLRGWLDYLYQFDDEEERDPVDSYFDGPIRSLYEERMERPRF